MITLLITIILVLLLGFGGIVYMQYQQLMAVMGLVNQQVSWQKYDTAAQESRKGVGRQILRDILEDKVRARGPQ